MLPSFLVILEAQVINNGGQWRNQTANQNIIVPSYNSSCPPTNKCWIERYINEDHDIFSSRTTKIYNYLKIDGKDNKHTWKGLSFRTTSSNRKGRSRIILFRWSPFLQGLEVYCSIDVQAWNSGYGTRAQPKNYRNYWTLSENSPSSELAPCCDVTRLSNLITVPDCRVFLKIPACLYNSTMHEEQVFYFFYKI